MVEAAALFAPLAPLRCPIARLWEWGALEMKLPAMLRGCPSDPDTSTRALQPVRLCKASATDGRAGVSSARRGSDEDTCSQQCALLTGSLLGR